MIRIVLTRHEWPEPRVGSPWLDERHSAVLEKICDIAEGYYYKGGPCFVVETGSPSPEEVSASRVDLEQYRSSMPDGIEDLRLLLELPTLIS